MHTRGTFGFFTHCKSKSSGLMAKFNGLEQKNQQTVYTNNKSLHCQEQIPDITCDSTRCDKQEEFDTQPICHKFTSFVVTNGDNTCTKIHVYLVVSVENSKAAMGDHG